jgi:hypothetical protein
MCRADINPTARERLGELLNDMAAALRTLGGLPADAPVVVGPVDFRAPEPSEETTHG